MRRHGTKRLTHRERREQEELHRILTEAPQGELSLTPAPPDPDRKDRPT